MTDAILQQVFQDVLYRTNSCCFLCYNAEQRQPNIFRATTPKARLPWRCGLVSTQATGAGEEIPCPSMFEKESDLRRSAFRGRSPVLRKRSGFPLRFHCIREVAALARITPKDIEIALRTPLFASFTREEAKQLIAALGGEVDNYPSGAILATAGQHAASPMPFFLLLTGQVQMIRYGLQGAVSWDCSSPQEKKSTIITRSLRGQIADCCVWLCRQRTDIRTPNG